MKMSARAFAVAMAISTFAAMGASANPITYKLEGDFTGTLNGTDFTTHATFTALGDTNTLFDGGYFQSVTLSGLSADAAGTTYTVFGNLSFFNNAGAEVAGFTNEDLMSDFIDFGSPVFSTYDPATAMAPISVTREYLGAFETDHGTVSLSDASNLVFSADVSGAVPEPASWALMVAGFGLAGFAMRSRRTAVRFA